MQPNLKPGDKFMSPGCNFEYEIIGACCLLYDREQLPYPSCSLSFRGKQPSWKRVGKRFVPDIGTSKYEVYQVALINRFGEYAGYYYWVFTYKDMGEDLKQWWYSLSKKAQKKYLGV